MKCEKCGQNLPTMTGILLREGPYFLMDVPLKFKKLAQEGEERFVAAMKVELDLGIRNAWKELTRREET